MSSEIGLLVFLIATCLGVGVACAQGTVCKVWMFIIGTLVMATMVFGPFVLAQFFYTDSDLLFFVYVGVLCSIVGALLFAMYTIEERHWKRVRSANEQRLAQLLQDNK